MSDPQLVSVVIPNWNGRELLPVVLRSLREQTFSDYEVVVVDNGSTDGSVEMLRDAFPEVRLVDLDTNVGFSAAVNQGIRSSTGELIALINNDVELDPEWLAAVVRAARADQTAGSFATRIRSYWDRSLIDSAGDSIRGLPTGRGHGEADGRVYDRPAYVVSACAAASAYRRSMLEEIGLFNEDLFAYSEDVELGLRAQIAGYRCRYVPTAISYHMGSTTSKRISATAAYLQVRNSTAVLLMTMPSPYLRRWVHRVVLHNLRVAYRAGGFVLIGRVALALLRWLPRIRDRRRQIFARRRITDKELLAILDAPQPLISKLLRRSSAQQGDDEGRDREHERDHEGAVPLEPAALTHEDLITGSDVDRIESRLRSNTLG